MSTEKMPDARESAICFAVYSTMHATLQLYRDLLEPWGLTYQQILVMSVVWGEDDVTPGRLAEALMLDSSTVAGLLKRLERDGLVERTADAADRRRVRITPTARSREILQQTGGLAACVAQAMSLSVSEAQTLLDLLHKMRSGVSEFARPDSGALALADTDRK